MAPHQVAASTAAVMPASPTTRILDAAANRASEGLRVIEDHLRFVVEDRHLTKLSKQLRHDLGEICSQLLGPDRYAVRDTQQDVGTDVSTVSESRRGSASEVCAASLERVKQSLRSLEEFSKIGSPPSACKFESLRYRLYTLEKGIALTQQSRLTLENVRLCALVNGQESIDQLQQLVATLCGAGVGMIQLRDKRLADRDLVERARQCLAIVRQVNGTARPLVIINDRPDIAAAVDADGVHLGQDDLGVKDARALVGPRKLIGVSTHSLPQARAAVLAGANYLGAGPTFPSTTKTFTELPGLDFLRQVAAEITLPSLAIGGIDAANLAQVLATGMTRVAVSGAIAAADDPGSAAEQLLQILAQGATC